MTNTKVIKYTISRDEIKDPKRINISTLQAKRMLSKKKIKRNGK